MNFKNFWAKMSNISNLNAVKSLHEKKTLKRKVRTTERNFEDNLNILLYFENPAFFFLNRGIKFIHF